MDWNSSGSVSAFAFKRVSVLTEICYFKIQTFKKLCMFDNIYLLNFYKDWLSSSFQQQNRSGPVCYPSHFNKLCCHHRGWNNNSICSHISLCIHGDILNFNSLPKTNMIASIQIHLWTMLTIRTLLKAHPSLVVYSNWFVYGFKNCPLPCFDESMFSLQSYTSMISSRTEVKYLISKMT